MAYDFEKELLHGIPHDLAADFLIRVRGTVKEANLEEAWDGLSQEEQVQIFKEAEALGVLEPGTDGYYGARLLTALSEMPKEATDMAQPLPPTAMGKNMAAPTMAASLPPTAMGQNTIKAAAKDQVRDPDEVGKERGRANAAADFERRSHRSHEQNREFVGRLGGAALGGAATHRLSKGSNPVATIGGALLGAHLGSRAGKKSGRDADVKDWDKKKHAFDQPMTPEGEVGNQPDIHQYLEGEQHGQAAEEQNAASYYQQRFQEATQQLQQTQEQAQQAQQMADGLQQQVSGSQQQIQASMQQAQLSSQAAMQNVQQAHEMAMGATQQAMEAQGEVLRQKQLAAAMRMGVMQVKDQVMGALANDPTEQLASQLTSPPPGSATGGQDPNAQGMQNPSTQAAGNPDPSQQQQPQAGSPEQAPGAQGQTNSAGTGEEGEAVSDGNSGQSSGPGSQSTAKGSTKVEIKQASPLSVPHALGGAALGALSGAAYSQMSNDPLRKKVNELSGTENRSFAQAMDLAQSKARLAMGEAAEEHPGATTALHALWGGATGASAGPGITKSLGNIGKNISEGVRNLRTG